jgi:hypothetical protein
VQLIDMSLTERSEEVHAIDLVGEVASLLLQGVTAQSSQKSVPRVPMAGCVRHFLGTLPTFGGEETRLKEIDQQLTELQDRSTRLSRAYRLMHLGLLMFAGALTSCLWGQGLLAGVIDLFMLRVMIQKAETPKQLLVKRVEQTDRFLEKRNIVCVTLLATPSMTPLTHLPSARLLHQGVTIWREDRVVLNNLQQAQNKGMEYFEARRETMAAPLRFYVNLFERMSQNMDTGEPHNPDVDVVQMAKFQLQMIESSRDTRAFFLYFSGGMFVFLLFVCLVSAFVFRGGARSWLLSIEVQRLDGQRAGRFRCAWRVFLAWVLPFGLLLTALILDTLFWLAWKPGTDVTLTTIVVPIMQGIAYLYLFVSIVYAIMNPTRAIHDRLAGTCLMPR